MPKNLAVLDAFLTNIARLVKHFDKQIELPVTASQ